MSLTLRKTLYSMTLVLGLGQSIVSGVFLGYIISSTSGVVGFAPLMHVFQGLAIGWSAFTWIWTGVLLSFNNRPLSTHSITRSLVHFASFTIFSIGWFALSIMLGTQFPLQCDFDTYSDGLAYVWCPGGASSFGLAVLLWILCSVNSFIIYRSTRKSGGLSVNVAECKTQSDSQLNARSRAYSSSS